MDPIGIYIHLPFCRAHCTYCPFAVSTDLSLDERYANALIREIEAAGQPGRRRKPRPADHGASDGLQGVPVDSIFFGGGTPSRSPLESLQRIAIAIRARFAVDAAAEFTVEANPEDVTPESLFGWRALGINRVSIGVQSFQDLELYPLGRGHRSDRARRAIADSVGSGVRTSIDLIAGLPQQTEASFQDTLRIAISSGAGHISLYLLDLEEGTALERQVRAGRAVLPGEEGTAELYLGAVETLANSGFRQYEISNFSRPGEESRHNLRYWQRRCYLGFGMSAHSFMDERRWANTPEIGRYMERIEAGRSAVHQHETLSDVERRRERLFLGLRQSRGLNYEDLIELCGQEAIEWTTQGEQEGWLVRSGGRVAFTPSGFLFSNEHISRLF